MSVTGVRGHRLASEDGGHVPARRPNPPIQRSHDSWAVQRLAGNQAVSGLLRGTSALLQEAVTGGGAALDPQIRAMMEARLGQGLGHVRVHTGPAAQASATALDADAYTTGSDVVFAAGRYAPQTTAGMRTLAHELTHVVQQQRGPVDGRAGADGVRVSHPHDRFETEAAQVAATLPAAGTAPPSGGLPTGELPGGGQPGGGRSTGTPQAGPSVQRCGGTDPAHCPCQGGAAEEEHEHPVVQRQEAGGPAPAPTPAPSGSGFVPRPPALPMGEGFTLYGVDLPPQVCAAIPEGSVTTLERVAGAAGVGAKVGLRGGNAALTAFGLPGAAAGGDAIGLVAIPRMNLKVGSPNFNVWDPAAPLDTWGHTAVYVRRGGRIVAVRGFNPTTATVADTLALAKAASRVESGLSALPAELSADAYLFTSTAARSIEYPVTAEQATRFLGELPDVGPGGRPGVPNVYTARPAVWAAGQQPPLPEPFCVGSNCGLWAIERVEQSLGGPVGRPGSPSVTAVTGAGRPPVPGTAGQGEVVKLFNEANVARAAGKGSPLTELPGATGPAVAAEVPRALRFVKIGGRVMLVVGVVAAGAELYTATPKERPRVAVGIAGGFAGGFGLGAGAGLVCGPGAPVCSIVAGLVLGTIGALGGRAIAEGAYDALDRPRDPNAYPGHSIVCPGCHGTPVRVPGTSMPPPGGAMTFEAFRQFSTSSTGRPATLTAAEIAALRAWLGEPATKK